MKNKVIICTSISIGIILGILIRSWSGVNWSRLEYGSIADWVSGIGTILAILSSILFFSYNNKAKFKIKIYFKDDDTKMEIKVLNLGRATGTFRYWGIKKNTSGKKEDLESFKISVYGNDKEDKYPFVVLPQGAISNSIIIDIADALNCAGYPYTSTSKAKIDVGILNGQGNLHELTVLIMNHKFDSVGNERII